MFKKLLLLLAPLSLIGCASTNMGSVSLNKTPEYPHNFESRISQAIQPALKEFNTDVFYKVSNPHRLQYRVTTNMINSQTFDGYGICYIVNAKNELGMPDGNKLFLFILDGDRILHSTYEMKFNVIEKTRIYSTCSQIQKAQ